MDVSSIDDVNLDRIETETQDPSSRPLKKGEEKTDAVAQQILSQPEGTSSIPLETKRVSHPAETKEKLNLAFKMQLLVALLLQISGQKSQNGRKEFDRLNKQLLDWANKAAEERGATGGVSWRAALTEVVANLSQYAFSDEATREAIVLMAKQTPSIAKLFESQHSMLEMKYSAEQNLVNQLLSTKNTEKQSDAGERQEYIELLRAAIAAALSKPAAPAA